MLIALIALAWLLVATTAGSALLFMNRSAVPREPVSVPTDIRGEWLDDLTLRRLIVHTVDDRSMEGLLASASPDGIVLVHAKLLVDKPVDLGGQIWLERSKVLFVQTIPAP